MGLFDFFKPKNKGIDDAIFNSAQFQLEHIALADFLYNQHNQNIGIVKEKLLEYKLNEKQADTIIEKFQKATAKTGVDDVKFNSVQFQNEISALALTFYESSQNINFVKQKLLEATLSEKQADVVIERIQKFVGKIDIEEAKFDSEQALNEFIALAQHTYFNNNHSIEIVRQKLIECKLNEKQVNTVIQKFEKEKERLGAQFSEELNSGRIKSIEFLPNPDHKPGDVTKDQIDRYIAYGAFQMERKSYKNAIEMFNKAIELDSSATLAYANLGGVYADTDELEKSVYNYDKAIQLEPQNAKFHFWKAGVLADMGRLQEALTSCQQSIDIAPQDIEARQMKMYLCKDLMVDSDNSAFVKSIDECLSVDDKNYTALGFKAQVQLGLNDVKGAAESAEKLFLHYYSANFATQLMVGVYNHISDKEEAMSRFDRLSSQLDKNGKYQLGYVKGLYLKGYRHYDEAIQIFSNLNLEYQFAWNYYQIGIIENIKGNTQACIQYLKRTFELDPSLKTDARQYIELQNLKNNPDFIQITK